MMTIVAGDLSLLTHHSNPLIVPGETLLSDEDMNRLAAVSVVLSDIVLISHSGSLDGMKERQAGGCLILVMLIPSSHLTVQYYIWVSLITRPNPGIFDKEGFVPDLG